jgi:outer membrane receptor protein involved in Fe transport
MRGVTLRGLTASGANCTLFGGWVAWNLVPLAAIDRVEVAHGRAGGLNGPDPVGDI